MLQVPWLTAGRSEWRLPPSWPAVLMGSVAGRRGCPGAPHTEWKKVNSGFKGRKVDFVLCVITELAGFKIW